MARGVAAVWVPVQDMTRAVTFYRETLGFDVTETNESWAEVDANGLLIGLNAREEPGAGGGGAVISFQPDGGIEEELQRLKTAGVELTGDVSDHSWGRIAPFRDSEGNDLQFYAPPTR